MAGEDQYINPIIQAMISSSQLQGQAQQRQNQLQQSKAENALRQHQLDLQQQQIENEHQQATDMLNKYYLPMMQAHLEQGRVGAMKDIGEASQSGVNVPQVFPGTPQQNEPEVNPTPTINLPGLGINNVPATAFPTQQQDEAHQANLTKAKSFAQTSGEYAAMAPYTAVANAHTEKLRQMENDAALQRTLTQGANQERVAGIHEAGEAANTAAREAGANYRTQLTQGFGTDPDNAAIYDNAEEAVINAEEELNKLPKPVQKHAMAIAAQKGDILPTDFKGYKAALDGAQSAQQLLSQARDLAGEYSSDSAGYTGLGSGLINGVKSLNPTGDLKSGMDSLESQVNAVRTGLGVSRSSNPETERLMKGLFSPMRTKQQNLDNIEALAKQLNTAVESQFPKNIPAQQKNRVLTNRGITDFGGYGSTKINTQQTAPSGTKYLRDKRSGEVFPDTPQNRQLHGLDPNAQIPTATLAPGQQ